MAVKGCKVGLCKSKGSESNTIKPLFYFFYFNLVGVLNSLKM